MPFANGRWTCPACGLEAEYLPVEEIKVDPKRYSQIVSDKHELIHLGCPKSEREDGNTQEAHDHAAAREFFQREHGVRLPAPGKSASGSDGDDGSGGDGTGGETQRDQ